MQDIISEIHVNLPLRLLDEQLLELFIERRLNPEIGVDAGVLDKFSHEDFSRVARIFHAAGRSVSLHGPFIDLSPGSPDPEIMAVTRRRLEQLLQLIPIFKPLSVVCHAGYDRVRYGFLADTWLEQAVATWGWLGVAIAAAGSQLVLENVYEDGPDDLAGLFERLRKHGVGFCLDVGHHSAFGRAPLSEWLAMLGPDLRHLHLHDNHGESDEHLPLGQGSIDFTPLWQFLEQQERRPLLTLEPHRREDLQPNLDYLDRVF